MKGELAIGLCVLGAGLGACEKGPPAAPAAPAAVVVTSVVQQDVPVYGEWIGTTAGDVNAEIRPKVEGYLLRRVYPEGSFVQHGALLFEIDSRQFENQVEQAQANLAQGEASLAKAERDVARYRPLAAERALSQQELDNAVSAEQVAQANVAALRAARAQARINLQWTKVRSPISGIAGAAQAQVGNLVNPQAVLTTVSRVDPIRVLFNVSEQEYLHYQESIRADPPTRVRELELVLADGTLFPHQGKQIFADRQVDVKTGSIGIVGLFPNPGNLLRPGQYAKVRAVTSVRKGALLVPQRAVNELQGAFQVAVVGADSKAEIRTVQTGEKVGSMWVITQGLRPGDRVVVEGFSRAKAGAVVSPQPAGTSAGS
ncbi:MAG TPA: efflux RND transporter periplasmic adaptor subunit [Thermoanaerobaculia bacterium]|nr:efflux RND transporter periplasmic adaptor subunit [Thermoanaerobaculia bacterium]